MPCFAVLEQAAWSYLQLERRSQYLPADRFGSQASGSCVLVSRLPVSRLRSARLLAWRSVELAAAPFFFAGEAKKDCTTITTNRSGRGRRISPDRQF